MSKQWSLTQQEFDMLLAWLAPEREVAGVRYEEIRQTLIKIFTWRGCSEAEDLSDETINRVAQKVGTLAKTYTGDPALYFYGVAKKLLLEYHRRPARASPPETEKPDDYERRQDCYEQCLEQLPPDQRDLIFRYYEGEKQARIDSRKLLAEQTGVDPNALRVRVHRIRTQLQRCLQDCLSREAAETERELK